MVKKKNDETDFSDLTEEMEESERDERLRIAESGAIADPRCWQLMYLDKCMTEAGLQMFNRKTAYESRMIAMRNELAGIIREWEGVQKKTARKIAEIRSELENDYGINMQYWGYDRETGVLQKLSPKEIEEIDEKKEGARLKEEDKIPDLSGIASDSS